MWSQSLEEATHYSFMCWINISQAHCFMLLFLLLWMQHFLIVRPPQQICCAMQATKPHGARSGEQARVNIFCKGGQLHHFLVVQECWRTWWRWYFFLFLMTLYWFCGRISLIKRRNAALPNFSTIKTKKIPLRENLSNKPDSGLGVQSWKLSLPTFNTFSSFYEVIR